jgi:hypothetical protein
VSELELAPEELEELEAWERRQGRVEFHRVELRRTTRRRLLDCDCAIDPREPYRYAVTKVAGVAELIQTQVCDFHMRADHRY